MMRRPAPTILLVLAAPAAQPSADPNRATPAPPTGEADARIAFYQVRLGGPGTYPAYARLGAAYLQKARETGRSSYLDDAERYLQRSLGFMRNQEALRWLAAVELEQHRFREALAHAQEAAAAWPGDLEAQGILFDIHLALGDLERAAAVAQQMSAGGPIFESLARQAALDYARADPAGALEAMARACADAEARSLPTESRAWCQVRLGALQLGRCQAAAAERAYKRALAILPGYHQAEQQLIELRAGQQRPGEALTLGTKLLSDHPSPSVQLMLAELLDQTGRRDQAARTRALALDELRHSAAQGARTELRTLALSLLDDDLTVAEGLRWALQDWNNRSDALAADALAWAYYRSGRISEARQTIERALQPGTSEPLVLLHAAYIYRRSGESVRARGLLDRALACPLRLSPAVRAAAEQLRAELQLGPAARLGSTPGANNSILQPQNPHAG